MGFASIVAQLLGGLLVSLNLFGWSWRTIFLINVPIGLVAIAFAVRLLRESRSARRPTLDFIGAGLISLGLFLLIYPLVEGREAGWPTWSFGMMLTALPTFFIFVLYERRLVRRGRTPLVALHLFEVPVIAFGLVVSIAFFLGLATFFVVLTVFFQSGQGYSAFSAGLMFLPFAIGFSAASMVSGAVAARLGGRVVAFGSFLMALGLLGVVVLAWIASRSDVGAIDARPLVLLFLIYGLGQGLAQPALINTVVGSAGVSAEDAGSAAGLFLTTAQSALALGVAAIGDIFFSRLDGTPVATDYAAALSLTLSCNLILQVATIVLVLMMPRMVRRS